jgi:hypothetical protein
MFRRTLVRVILPAVLGLPAGFLALGFAVGYGQELPSPLLYLIAPGMGVASHIFPHRPKSLASTIGGFLDVSLAVNFIFYFAIFAVIAYVMERRISK